MCSPLLPFEAEEFFVTLHQYVELSWVYLLLEHRYPTEHAVMTNSLFCHLITRVTEVFVKVTCNQFISGRGDVRDNLCIHWYITALSSLSHQKDFPSLLPTVLELKKKNFCLIQNASNNLTAGCWDYIAHPLLRLYLAKFSPLWMNEEEDMITRWKLRCASGCRRINVYVFSLGIEHGLLVGQMS
jgi:hypothetical protein